MMGNARRPAGARPREEPDRRVGPTRATSGSQKEGGARRPGPRGARASGSHPSPAPCPSSPRPFLFADERNDAQARTAVRTQPGGWTRATNTAATSPPGEDSQGGGHGRDGDEGEPAPGAAGAEAASRAAREGRAGQGARAGERRTRPSAGPGPGGGVGGRRAAGVAGAAGATAAGRAAGRPFPRGAPGGARMACSRPPPPPRESDRRAGRMRNQVTGWQTRRGGAPGPEEGRGREPAGRAGPRGGDSAAGPRSLPAPIKVERPGLAARPRLRPPLCARGVDILQDSRDVPSPALPGTPPPGGGGGGGWRLRGLAKEGAHPQAGGRDAAGINFA